MKRLFLIVSILCSYLAIGQPQMEKIIPLNPDAAAIERYGEMPVGHFTGIPNVGVPVYTLTSKTLSLPLSLNYHAGGNKVEDVASWVGLGWSVNTLPTISRKVNGIPDEASGGFFNLYQGSFTAEKMYDSTVVMASTTAPSMTYMLALYNGETDSEADMYSFSLVGKSGKFFWDQKTQRFLVTPWQNVLVERASGGFNITDEDGTLYFFHTKDITASTIATSWVVDRMYNANRTDSLVFDYTSGSQTIKTLNAQNKLVWGNECATSFDPWTINYSTNNTISAIYFNGGWVSFTKDTAARQDLQGGHSLNNITVFNSANDTIKRMNFYYSYRGSGVNYEDKRLQLDSVLEKTTSDVAFRKYWFKYDSSIAVPSRLSFQQDYWGFYNGQSSNTGLVPDAHGNFMGSTVVLPGANRSVDTTKTGFGILKRMYYPTGGYTDFEYENNRVYSPSMLSYTGASAILYSDDIPAITSYFSTNFEIDNPSDAVLNGGSGGAYVKIRTGGIACYACSNIRLVGLDPGNSHIWMAVSGNSDVLLPNGNYEMVADFGTQDSEDYEEFYYSVSWNVIDTTPSAYNSMVGGLRIKNIKSHDGFGNRINRNYRYTNTLASDTSSGDVFSYPYYIAYEDYTCINYIFGGYTENYNYRISASPLATQVSHSGSFVGYKTVYEFVDSLGALGVNEYKFGHAHDMISPVSPFPPPYSMELYRGEPLEQNVYRKQGNALFPISRTRYEYISKTFDSLASFNYKARLKRDPVYVNGYMLELPMFEHTTYENIPQWVQQSKKTEIIYDASDTTKKITTITDYGYHDSLYQLANTKYVNSKGDTIKTKMYYPADLALMGDAESGRAWLITQNNIQAVLKQETYNDNTLTGAVQTDYKVVGSMVFPSEIFQKIGAGASESRIKFLDYSEQGNLIAQQKTDDVVASYIWAYNNKYPVAEIINANTASAAYSSFESDGKGGWSYSGSTHSDNTSPTGNKCYLLSGGDVTRSGLASGTYIVSYWGKYGSVNVNSAAPTLTGKSIGDWTYYEHVITGTSVTVSGSRYIDELRLYPDNAQMKTFTYKPLVGMTSQCDVTNRIVYYEYDAFGHLTLIKDQDRNILKKICYNYAGQPENCLPGVNTAAIWSSTSEVRCKPCPSNNAYITNMQQHEEIDSNPYSATYNTTRWVDDNVEGSCAITPDWQNTATSPTCLTNACGNTGYQQQEQRDMNPCSGTYNTTRMDTVYNASACTPVSGVTIYYDNMMPSGSSSGFSVTYTNISTAQIYTFSIPTTGAGTLGCIPAGSYRIVIGKTGNMWQTLYGTGCSYQTGTSTVTFKLVVIGGDPACNVISLEIDSV